MIRGRVWIFVGGGKFVCRVFKPEIFFRPLSGQNFSSRTRVKACLPESEAEYFFSSGYEARFFFPLQNPSREFKKKNLHPP